MARPSDLGDVALDPGDVAAYKRIVAPTPPPIEPPQQDHPIVQFAKQQLAPMRDYGTTPRESGRTGQVATTDFNNPYRPAPSLPRPQGFLTPGNQYEPPATGMYEGREVPTIAGPVANRGYDFPFIGGVQRASEAIFGPQGLLPIDVSNPLNAYGPVGHLAGYVPEAGAVAGAALRGFGAGADRAAVTAIRTAREGTGGRNLLTSETGLAGFGSKGRAADAATAELAQVEGGLASRIGTKPGSVGVGAGADTSLQARQAAALKAGGASEQEIADFAATMAPATKPKPKFTIQTAEGQQVDPGLLTRSIKSAAAEDVPLSQHSILGAKVAALRKGVPSNKWGGDIGAATTLVMNGDEDALRIFGPELSQQLIQNKIAHLVRQTGAPEETIRKGLSLMGPDAAAAPVEKVAAVTKTVAAVEDALGVPTPPKPGFRKTAEELIAERQAPLTPPAPPSGGYTPPPGGSFMPADTPLPEMPNAFNAGDFAKNLAAEIFALPRALKAGLDLSAVALQGSILIAKDVTKLPIYAYTALRGGSQRPFFHSALGSMFKAVVSGERQVAQVTNGFRNSLETAGFKTNGALKNVHISDPTSGFGNLAAREEYMVGNLVTRIPVIGLLFRQANFGYATLLNGLRTGEALNLVRASEEMGLAVNHAKIGHFVDIATGYGDLPFQDTEVAHKVASGLSNVFFGPRLTTASVQNVVDNIAAVGGVGKSIVSRKPLDPTDIARLHATTAFVAAGVSAMKLAEASGLQVGTDPTATNFGRITMPNGWRVDLWGPFNENARLVAREIEYVRRSVAGEPPGYGEKNGIDEFVSTARGKLNPPMAMVADWIAGKTGGGVPTREAYSSTDPNVNPLIPAPFSVGTAIGVPKDVGGAALAAASFFGASVMPPSANTKYDGIGRADSNPEFGKDPIFDEYTRLFPGKQLDAPDSTLGSGKNTFPLPPDQRAMYVQMIGNERRVALGDLIYSQEYQNMTKAQQEKKYKQVQSDADAKANREYLKSGVIQSDDPALITAAAVTGFHAQGSNKDAAYWIATLDKAGKLTPEVKQAIDESNVALPGQAQPITVDEYLKAAPLVHEYLSHAPYGSDKNPIGTPQDWVAVDAAKKQTSVLRDQYIRSGMQPSQADTQAKVDALKQLKNMTQRALYVNGANLVNVQRKLLETKYKTMLTRFLGPGADYTQETVADYP